MSKWEKAVNKFKRKQSPTELTVQGLVDEMTAKGIPLNTPFMFLLDGEPPPAVSDVTLHPNMVVVNVKSQDTSSE